MTLAKQRKSWKSERKGILKLGTSYLTLIPFVHAEATTHTVLSVKETDG